MNEYILKTAAFMFAAVWMNGGRAANPM
ncbi:uncharacterized protein METZ01_LOCUS97750, partial [marine metagenome]